MTDQEVYHFTILSNFTSAYDKYSRTYCKKHISESRFPDEFYLLARCDRARGIAKARRLLDKTNLPADRVVAFKTAVSESELRPNVRTGIGLYIERDWVRIEELFEVGDDGELMPLQVEEALAAGLRVLSPILSGYTDLRPRSVSVLPVAIGCQAACAFCYSKASASADQGTTPIDWLRVRRVLREGQRHGAERAVVTGGGEPGLLPFDQLVRLVRECADVFPKVVLITNGYFLQRLSDADRVTRLAELARAGLAVLSVSRHHWDDADNSAIMNLDTRPQAIAAAWHGLGEGRAELRLRWVCVLQRGGVDSGEALAQYLDWAVPLGVTEFCFKELYVSTSHESVYHSREANEWSRQHQVPLAVILDAARAYGWEEIDRLPWGAPLFRGNWRGQTIQVAAYTEPSVFWERTRGVCRSWNLMADGRCLASLEDRESEVCPGALPTISGGT